MPNVRPTAYGLGKAGWVSATFEGDVPADTLLAWLDESYRAVAPAKLVKQIAAPTPAKPSPAARATRAPRRRAAPRRAR